jgi:hypothetical protein
MENKKSNYCVNNTFVGKKRKEIWRGSSAVHDLASTHVHHDET